MSQLAPRAVFGSLRILGFGYARCKIHGSSYWDVCPTVGLHTWFLSYRRSEGFAPGPLLAARGQKGAKCELLRRLALRLFWCDTLSWGNAASVSRWRFHIFGKLRTRPHFGRMLPKRGLVRSFGNAVPSKLIWRGLLAWGYADARLQERGPLPSRVRTRPAFGIAMPNEGLVRTGMSVWRRQWRRASAVRLRSIALADCETQSRGEAAACLGEGPPPADRAAPPFNRGRDTSPRFAHLRDILPGFYSLAHYSARIWISRQDIA